MPHPTNVPGKNRRFVTLLILALSILSLLYLFSRSHPTPPGSPLAHTTDSAPIHEIHVSKGILKGEVISSKIGNETLKAELGRAAWKVLHTTMAKFPDKPTPDEQEALASYLHLFARLYPCGECAAHFRIILAKFPPQVSTRSTAAAWACHVHNEVNKSLKKDLFDCSKIGDFYDCGCAEDAAEEGKKPLRKASGERINLAVERNGPTQGA